jgi:hypothetical protein
VRGATRITLAVVGLAAWGRLSAAQTPAPADAFAQAETKFAAGDHAGACPLYEQAQAGEAQLPWKNAFLASTKLALCKKDDGKLASAVALYRHAAEILRTQSTSHDNDARAAAAQKAADDLALQVSHLTVTVPTEAAAIDGLAITLDGADLPAARWNTAIEIDGGDHVVHASAAGRAAFVQKVTVATQKDAQEVKVPVLAANVVKPTPPTPPIAPPAPATEEPERSHVPALAAAAVGVVATGVAIGVDLSARSTYDKYKQDPTHPASQLDSANRKRHVANALGVVGGVSIAAAAVLWFVWPAHAPDDDRAGTAFVPVVGPDLIGGAAVVRF